MDLVLGWRHGVSCNYYKAMFGVLWPFRIEGLGLQVHRSGFR